VRAASEAAAAITPTGVKEILETYGVATVNELDQEQRQEFVQQMAVVVEGSDDG
jgi:uncharacterized tellurite resistance protein B-like protein